MREIDVWLHLQFRLKTYFCRAVNYLSTVILRTPWWHKLITSSCPIIVFSSDDFQTWCCTMGEARKPWKIQSNNETCSVSLCAGCRCLSFETLSDVCQCHQNKFLQVSKTLWNDLEISCNHCWTFFHLNSVLQQNICLSVSLSLHVPQIKHCRPWVYVPQTADLFSLSPWVCFVHFNVFWWSQVLDIREWQLCRKCKRHYTSWL